MKIDKDSDLNQAIDFTLIPEEPGSYQFRNEQGRIIYVGKASSLRSRVRSYFQDERSLSPKTAQLMREAVSLEWVQVSNDSEAVLLEYSLIKHNRPKFNIALRDDKSYPYLSLSMQDRWPRPLITRGAHRKGTKYFGPYTSAGAIRETLELLLKTFPIRSCNDTKFRRHEKLQKPCLLYHIHKCSGPCIDAISRDDYYELVGGMIQFLQGRNKAVIDDLVTKMERAASELDFEKAAEIRDSIQAAQQVVSKQDIAGDRLIDCDICGFYQNEIEGRVEIFHVRNGFVIGRWGFVLEIQADAPLDELMATTLNVLYEKSVYEVPKEIILPELPREVEMYNAMFSKSRGSLVSIRRAARGYRKRLLDMATLNAKKELERSVLEHTRNHKSRTLALEGLRSALEMKEAPYRIECYDMSHIQGTDYVGSMVVMVDGLPDKKEYRHFRVRSVLGNDDYGAMREVLMRRLGYLVDSDRERSSESFAKVPNLIVVDGGKGQLNVAVDVVKELGLAGTVTLCSLAKRNEEVFVPHSESPLALDRISGSIYLLQSIRDEAHRFAITYHRSLRGKRMVTSLLDGIDGLGDKRKERLLKEVGGVKGLRSMTISELKEISWLSDKIAENLFRKLHPESVMGEVEV